MIYSFEYTIPNGKGRLPSRFFFSSLFKLGVDIDKYLLPPEWNLTPYEMFTYCQAIEFDLLTYVKEGGFKNQDYFYARDILNTLKTWASRGYDIKIL